MVGGGEPRPYICFMPLSLAELRHRATAFALEYADTASERAEFQSFWRDFLDVFGQNRRRIAQFEVPVKKADGGQGFIDMFIPGKLIVEQKTLGRDLRKATTHPRRPRQRRSRCRAGAGGAGRVSRCHPGPALRPAHHAARPGSGPQPAG